MDDPKFMAMLIVIITSSASIKRSGMAYGKKMLLAAFLTFCLSLFYYNNYPKEKTNMFFPVVIFLAILFSVGCEKEEWQQVKAFFKKLMRRIKNRKTGGD